MISTFYKNIEEELTNLEFQITDSNLEKPWALIFALMNNNLKNFLIFFLMDWI